MIDAKRTAGHCKKYKVKIGKVVFTARHHCGPKWPAQKRLAAAGKACAGTGKIGGKARTSCLRSQLRKKHRH